MGWGRPLTLAAMLLLLAPAVAAALPDPANLLRPAGSATSSAPEVPTIPGASPDVPDEAAAAPRDLLALLAGAVGAVGGGLASVAGAIAGAGAGIANALLALLGAIAGAIAAGAGALLGAVAAAVGALAAMVAAFLGAITSGAGRAAARLAQDPRPLGHVAVGSAVLGLEGLARVRGFAPFSALYSRLADHELLTNDARRRIYDFVQAMPGAHVSQVCSAMGLGWGTTVYHLNRLRDGQLLSARRVGNQLCHFVNGSAHTPDEQRVLAATKAPKAQAIVDYLKLRGPSTQHAIAAELGMSSALVSWHAKRLEELGVVERMRTGRACVLTLRPPARTATRPAPPALPAAPMAA
ncbi:MAG TPA: winged helix-turn-helix transcriptional regulator [Candidatus Thermoplasmatota archaeon]|jgi:predicted transcriptional regulator|nr:winged helix-turn-helix transcriptional regulator [Candidatus Thermoplasmatota archaeon]